MKKRNLFLTLGLALTLGAGVAGGLSLNRGEVKEVEARDIGPSGSYYIYYVSDSLNETQNQIHAWNAGGDFDTWPGDSIATVGTDIHGSFNFQGGAKKIYKICFDEAPTGFMFTWGDPNSGGSKSKDMSFTNGAAYWWSDYTLGNTDAGAALDLLVETESYRNAVRTGDHGAVANYSICGIDPVIAGAQYDKYFDLSSSIKTNYIDNTEVYTYTDKTGTTEGMVSYYNVFMMLKSIAQKAGVTVKGAGFVNQNNISNESGTVIAIVLVSSIGLITIGSIFVIRRRKEQD